MSYLTACSAVRPLPATRSPPSTNCFLERHYQAQSWPIPLISPIDVVPMAFRKSVAPLETRFCIPVRLAIHTSVEREGGIFLNTEIVSTTSAPNTVFVSDRFDVPAASVAVVSAAGMIMARDPALEVTEAIETAGAWDVLVKAEVRAWCTVMDVTFVVGDACLEWCFPTSRMRATAATMRPKTHTISSSSSQRRKRGRLHHSISDLDLAFGLTGKELT